MAKKAREKLMDYLARRDHSKKELRQKLLPHFEIEEIETAIAEAEERGWILPPDELAAKAANELHRKHKGYLYILNFLKDRDLPPIEFDFDREREKAEILLSRKFGSQRPFSWETKQQAARYLANRGYQNETVQTVLFDSNT